MLLTLLLAVAFGVQGCHSAALQTVLQVQNLSDPAVNFSALPVKYEAIDTSSPPAVPSPPLEILPLVVSGSPSNRVDLVFFSDGYLPEEREKFVADATRLAADISTNQTFSTVKPLLNFWAAFSPSKESGIGVGGVPRDTPFGLYRDGSELRGVYYSKPEVAGAACSSLGSQCDYPILLGNDPYYGGLGGDFTVITSSLANGPLVLRHELGHSIIEVGEEYDGGSEYFGVNAYHDLAEPVPWAHWLSPQALSVPHVERSVMPIQLYPWTMLNTSAPWSVTFPSSGTYPRHLVRFSLSGLSESTDLKVELDGNDLEWVPRPDIGLDRWHYDIPQDRALGPGPHELKFTLLSGKRVGVAQLCSVELLEFGNEQEFVATPGHYGIYPTFSHKNETSYRPTNDDCLMRSVTSPNFCKVCIEGLWLSLLRRVNLIDGIKEDCRQLVFEGITDPHWVKTIDVELVPLAQFREVQLAQESYAIKWWKDGVLLKEFTNRTSLKIADTVALGTYSVEVKLSTEEVRVDRDNLLSDGVTYQVTNTCAPV